MSSFNYISNLSINKLQQDTQHMIYYPMRLKEHHIDGKNSQGRNALNSLKRIKPIYPVSINHSPKMLEIKIELQSFCKEEVHLHITEDTIYLNAVHIKKNKQRASSEYAEDLSRIFTIPSDTNREKIKTTFLNHEMKILLPKSTQKQVKDVDFG